MRVLLVTYMYTPDARAGAVRPTVVAEGLAALGHDVKLLTACANPSLHGVDGLVVPSQKGAMTSSSASTSALGWLDRARMRWRVLDSAIRVLAHTSEMMSAVPDRDHRWIRDVREFLGNHQEALRGIDLVIATSPPISAAYIGRDVADTLGVPLVLDLRDLWTDSPYYPYRGLRRAVDRRAEALLFARADSIICTTGAMADVVRNRGFGAPVSALYNAVEAHQSADGALSDTCLVLGHFGSTYDGLRDATPLLLAVARLAEDGCVDASQLQVNFVGRTDSQLRQRVSALELEDIFRLNAPVERSRVAEMLDETHVAVVLMWSSDDDSIPLKLIEYLEARRSVLVIGASESSELRIVCRGIPGVRFANTEDQIAAALSTYMKELQQNGASSFVWPSERSPFSQSALVDGFDAVVKRLGETGENNSIIA